MTPDALLAAFGQQQRWCSDNGAPFSARVLAAATAWLQGDAEAHAVLAAAAPDPVAGAVPLRLLAGLHRLALQGRAPWAALWPPAAGSGDDAALQDAVRLAWRSERAVIDQALASPPQTNEVQRSAVLLPGLLNIAQRTGLPLALMEIGASAGLNRWVDQHRLETTAWVWGDEQSALKLCPEWRGPAPGAGPGAPLPITRRAGCDVQPIDLSVPDEALRLQSYVWPDQPDRLQRLRIAIDVARTQMAARQVRVQRAGAAAFVQQQLAQRRAGVAWVLMHSVMWQYMPAHEQVAVSALMEQAGAGATKSAPLAWLRFEPPQPHQPMELRCRVWPTGSDTLLARAHPHGAWVEWLADT